METQDTIINRFSEIRKNAEKARIDVHLVSVDVDYSIPVENCVAESYAPYQGNATEKENIILMSFPGLGMSGNIPYFEKALQWGEENGLRRTTPHVLIALNSSNPNLGYEIDEWPDKLLIETAGCKYEGVDIAFYLMCHYRYDMQYGIADIRAYSEDGENFPNSKSWFAFRM